MDDAYKVTYYDPKTFNEDASVECADLDTGKWCLSAADRMGQPAQMTCPDGSLVINETYRQTLKRIER